MKFLFADKHIFKTVQGEGYFLGTIQMFFRLAGCSVGCKFCDTKYNHNKLAFTISDIVAELSTIDNKEVEWIWITGGEPTDQDVGLLIRELQKYFPFKRFALATSGIREVKEIPFNFISVSPHGKPSDLKIHEGNQINLVPDLNGNNLLDWFNYDFSGFIHKYITPCDKRPETLGMCLDWVEARKDFKLGIQAHKTWGVD